uniref:Uncharacterized protein n=1 Tax=Arundo donax TaxID=35708 RepID=A0A0A9HN85_ARUDO
MTSVVILSFFMSSKSAGAISSLSIISISYKFASTPLRSSQPCSSYSSCTREQNLLLTYLHALEHPIPHVGSWWLACRCGELIASVVG